MGYDHLSCPITIHLLTQLGWTAPGGREFLAVGQTDGTAFVEIGPQGGITYVGRLPTQTVNSLWRDIKVINGCESTPSSFICTYRPLASPSRFGFAS